MSVYSDGSGSVIARSSTLMGHVDRLAEVPEHWSVRADNSAFSHRAIIRLPEAQCMNAGAVVFVVLLGFQGFSE